MKVFYCIEDPLSRAVAERLINNCCPPGSESQELGKTYGGNGYIKINLNKFHNLSLKAPVLIITDLDHATCPPSLRESWLESANIAEPLPPNMLFCIAQTEIESWLLADKDGIAHFLKISPARIDSNVESSILNSKEYLVQLAKTSRNTSIRSDLTPARMSAAATGINYNQRLMKFVENEWNIDNAAANSQSLQRTIAKLSSI